MPPLVLALITLWGCIPEAKPGFDSPAPSKRLDAIVNASSLEDDESLVKLVEKLRSPDPVERMFAIRSLEIRTGETLGYDHAAEHWQRLGAYTRWLEYLERERGIEIPHTMRDETGDATGEEKGDTDGDPPPGHEENKDQPMEEDAG